MRQAAPQNSDRPPRGTSRSARPTTTRGSSGGLLVLMIEDGSQTVLSASNAEERSQSGRRAGPRRTTPR